MATTLTSAALVPVAPVFGTTERLALAGVLGRVQRPDPPDVRAGHAPVRQLKLSAPAAAVRPSGGLRSSASPGTCKHRPSQGAVGKTLHVPVSVEIGEAEDPEHMVALAIQRCKQGAGLFVHGRIMAADSL